MRSVFTGKLREAEGRSEAGGRAPGRASIARGDVESESATPTVASGDARSDVESGDARSDTAGRDARGDTAGRDVRGDATGSVSTGSAATSADTAARRRESSRPLASSAWRTPLVWTLAALLLRFLLVWRVEHVISPDGVGYVTLGQHLVRGDFSRGLSTYFPPLYPLLAGLASLLFRDPELAGRMVSVVAGGLLVVPTYMLVRRWYGERVARTGACIVALHPLLVYYSTVLLTESTYTLLFTCGVLAGWTALEGGRARTHALAGAFVGACYLLKPEAAGFLLLLLLPALGAIFFKPSSFKPARSRASRVRSALALCAGFALLALPYLLYLHAETGAWTISGKLAGHFWQGSRTPGDAPPPASTLLPGATVIVVQLTKALRYEFELFNLIFPAPFVLLVGLGLFRTSWTRPRIRREAYLASFTAAALAGYAVTLPNIRFIVPLLPLLICWLSNGIVELEGWASETLGRFGRGGEALRRVQRLFVPLVVALLLVSLLPLFVYLVRGDKWSDYHGQKRAALWIKERTQEGRAPVIMSTVPVAAFYAGGRNVPLVDEDYAALLARVRVEGVDYIIVNERNVKQMSLLRTLLDEQAQHDGLHLVHRLADAPGHRILVYAPSDSVEKARGLDGQRPAPPTARTPETQTLGTQTPARVEAR